MDNCGCAMARKQEGKERWQQGKKKGDKGWQDKQQGNQYLINFDGYYAVLFGYFRNCNNNSYIIIPNLVF